MATDNIKRLSLKLLATPLAENGSVYIPCEDYQEITGTLPNLLCQEVNLFVENLRSIIPNDFKFWLFFVTDGVDLSIEFEDGDTSASAGGGFFTSQKSLLRKMRAVNWDERRGVLIQRGGIFEEMVSAAADRPVNIPSSEAAAKKYGVLLIREIGKNRRLNPHSPFTLILGRDDLGISSEQFNTRDEVVYTIADRMTTQNDILMILEQCGQWTFEQIEAAKLEAVEQLGPISRAKAEGRFFAQ